MHSKSGFTFTETIIVLAIMSFVILGISSFQKDVISFNRTLYNALIAAQDGKNAMKMMTSEIRSMQTSNLGGYPLLEAATSSITFFTDTDLDGYKNQIRYFLSTTSPGTLIKQVIRPSGSPLSYLASTSVYTTVATDIKNPSTLAIFTYYDSSYEGSTSSLPYPLNIQKVRLVKITLLIERDPIKAPNPTTYSTQVSLRNLKDNL